MFTLNAPFTAPQPYEAQMPNEECYPVTIMGRTIGTSTGWDGDEDCVVFYDFVPHNVLADELKSGDLSISYTEGWVRYYDDKGEVLTDKDLIPILTMIARDKKD